MKTEQITYRVKIFYPKFNTYSESFKNIDEAFKELIKIMHHFRSAYITFEKGYEMNLDKPYLIADFSNRISLHLIKYKGNFIDKLNAREIKKLKSFIDYNRYFELKKGIVNCKKSFWTP
jgi:hypothetical protein